jgi:glutamate-1-semialdehyde 2,1-aminomutase
MTAGLTTLKLLSERGFHDQLHRKTKLLVDGILEAAKKNNVPLTANYIAGMFGLFFSKEEKITSFAQVTACNQDHFNKFFHGMLNHGIYLAPSSYEAGFISAAHTEEDIQQTIEIANKVFASI